MYFNYLAINQGVATVQCEMEKPDYVVAAPSRNNISKKEDINFKYNKT